ncbi:hypothetical protein BC829DRAFT_393223 [Chytridium lagenaria]|nr:hypothetical protein BC829DRAFT_393223 [Chytridium lagenaria]
MSTTACRRCSQTLKHRSPGFRIRETGGRSYSTSDASSTQGASNESPDEPLGKKKRHLRPLAFAFPAPSSQPSKPTSHPRPNAFSRPLRPAAFGPAPTTSSDSPLRQALSPSPTTQSHPRPIVFEKSSLRLPSFGAPLPPAESKSTQGFKVQKSPEKDGFKKTASPNRMGGKFGKDIKEQVDLQSEDKSDFPETKNAATANGFNDAFPDIDDSGFEKKVTRHKGEKKTKKPIEEGRKEVASKKLSPKAKEELRRKKLIEAELKARPVQRDIFIPTGISIANLSAVLKIPFEKLARILRKMGLRTRLLSSENASLICMELGYNPIVAENAIVDIDIKQRPDPEDWSIFPHRPPIVTIMGHVDHGKTTLLDSLRKTSVAKVKLVALLNILARFLSGKQITFLDTPGHAAFSAMRKRGANVTDIVVLVVAADDGVMPQTLEAIKHTIAADVQMVVAINKCDKPNVKIVVGSLKNGVILEEHGGDIPVVLVSGLTGKGLIELEETILTLAELADIRGDPSGPTKRGTLKTGQFIVAGQTWCKVRSIVDSTGKRLLEATPSTPVEVSGWKDLPIAGDLAIEALDEELAKAVVDGRKEKQKRDQLTESIDSLNKQRMKVAEVEDVEVEVGKPTLHLIFKGDVNGSLEAICDSVQGLPSHEVVPNIVFSGVGAPALSDVELAAATHATLIAFNTPVEKKIVAAAKSANVTLKQYNIVYELLDSVKEMMSELLPPEEIVEVIGEADILQVFEINVKGKTSEPVAGCRIVSGKILRNERVKIERDGGVIFDASKGLECGIGFEKFTGFNAGTKNEKYNKSL